MRIYSHTGGTHSLRTIHNTTIVIKYHTVTVAPIFRGTVRQPWITLFMAIDLQDHSFPPVLYIALTWNLNEILNTL